MPVHHNAEAYLGAYLAAADIAEDRKGPLFRSVAGRSGQLTANAMSSTDVLRTTKLYDRRSDAISLDEIEQIII